MCAFLAHPGRHGCRAIRAVASVRVVPVRRSSPALLVVALAAAAGCARVMPHERETLARPDMELGGNADLASGEDHARAYREGSTGGPRSKAGGCGCN